MFFVLSKVLGFFAQPTNLLLTVGLLGALLLATRFVRAGKRLLVASIVLLTICGLSPIGNVLILPLEERFPRWDPARGAPDGIVVLGGAVDPPISASRDSPALIDSAERMTGAVELARAYPSSRFMFTGGTGSLLSDTAEAEYAKRLFVGLGIAPERIELESRSRNTVENAVFTKALVEPKANQRWLLVTSAAHMPRAIGTFRQAGFPVEAFPVDWRTRGPADRVVPFANARYGFQMMDVAMHEWVGLVAYWLTGRIPELFPGPGARGGCDTAALAEACRP